MGSDTVYLSVEPAAGVDPDTLESRLASGETFDRWSGWDGETIHVAGYEKEWEPALQRLQEVEDSVQRAFILHYIDTATRGFGWVYERTADGLVQREEILGAHRYGIDIVDYVKREYDIDGPR